MVFHYSVCQHYVSHIRTHVLKVSESNRKHKFQPSQTQACCTLLLRQRLGSVCCFSRQERLSSAPQAGPGRTHRFGAERPRVSYSNPKLSVSPTKWGYGQPDSSSPWEEERRGSIRAPAQVCPRCLTMSRPHRAEPPPDGAPVRRQWPYQQPASHSVMSHAFPWHWIMFKCINLGHFSGSEKGLQ